MSSKLDRAKYGPSWTEVIFGAFLSIVIGVIAGFLMLALKPVITAKEIPKDAPPGQVYFIPGSKASASGPAVEKKEKALELTIIVISSELARAYGPPPVFSSM